jgi:glutamate dehydrogenase/leucine dehydrogenase
LEGKDGKFRIFAPGGIRWVDYADNEAAISDALDMSLAVALKIQVVGAPTAGNKISVFGDIRNKTRALRAIFSAYERMGLIVTSADLGLSLKDLERDAEPVAPTSIVPMGVYRQGVSSASVTAQGAIAALKAMAKHLTGSSSLSQLKVSIQGLGEVGYLAAELLLEHGARLFIAEVNPDTVEKFRSEHRVACDSGRAEILSNPDSIYDTSADIFFPCARRDILNKINVDRLVRAGVRMIGGPANNLFPDQREGPWYCHHAGLPVVPYEGIGAGGVTGVAYSIMTGIYGQCPFTIKEKVDQIGAYVDLVLVASKRYDLPPQVVSDRLLFQRAKRRRVVTQDKYDEILGILLKAFHSGNRSLEAQVTLDYTKNGLFYGSGRFEAGGWRYLNAA